MTKSQSRGWREIRAARDRQTFVGRTEQIERFRDNVRNVTAPNAHTDDVAPKFIFNIWGQGGVGKTSLLRRFMEVAKSEGAITSLVSDAEPDPLSVMRSIADQMHELGRPLKPLEERLTNFDEIRLRLEREPDAPVGLFATIAGGLTRGTVLLGRQMAGPVTPLEFVNEDHLADMVTDSTSELVSFIARHLRDRKDFDLAYDPLRTLTRVFVESLRRLTEVVPVILFFDAYERTGKNLDSWLRALALDRYGRIPAGSLLAVAGRNALDGIAWGDLENFIERIRLQPFSPGEAREYLTLKGFTDQARIDSMVELSRGLPFWLAIMSRQDPESLDQGEDAVGDVVDRFLRWEDDPRRKEAALTCSIPRRINRDILARVVSEAEADSLFNWLIGTPLVEERSDGWVYDDAVRPPMLRYMRRRSEEAWGRIHRTLASHYTDTRDTLGMSPSEGLGNDRWETLTLERLYHLLCGSPSAELPTALNAFVVAYAARPAFASKIARTIKQAGTDMEDPGVRRWGELLMAGATAIDDGRYQEASRLFAKLEASGLIKEQHVPAIHYRLGLIQAYAGRFSRSIAEFSQAILLKPNAASYYQSRALSQLRLRKYQHAIGDFTQALALRPAYVAALIGRATAYHRSGQPQEALNDLQQALDLDPVNASALMCRASIYRAEGRYDEALAQISNAISAHSDNTELFIERALLYARSKHIPKALDDLERALENEPGNPHALFHRAEIYQKEGQFDEAEADLNEVLRLHPEAVGALLARARMFIKQGRHAEALEDARSVEHIELEVPAFLSARGRLLLDVGEFTSAERDFSRAMELDPDKDEAGLFLRRAEARQWQGRYEEALLDFDKAARLGAERSQVHNLRGLVLSYLHQFPGAIESFESQLLADPGDYSALYNIAVTMVRWKGIEKAGPEMQRARESLHALETSQDSRSYGLGGLAALECNMDEALAYLKQALECNPEVARWAYHDLAWLDLRTDNRFRALMGNAD